MVLTQALFLSESRPMKARQPSLIALERSYRRLARDLGHLGYLSKGSVVARAPGHSGSRYQWTTKVSAKTVSMTLGAEQYHWLKQAVANQRKLERTLASMHRLSRQIMRVKFPDPPRRKKLNKKVLRLI